MSAQIPASKAPVFQRTENLKLVAEVIATKALLRMEKEREHAVASCDLQ